MTRSTARARHSGPGGTGHCGRAHGHIHPLGRSDLSPLNAVNRPRQAASPAEDGSRTQRPVILVYGLAIRCCIEPKSTTTAIPSSTAVTRPRPYVSCVTRSPTANRWHGGATASLNGLVGRKRLVTPGFVIISSMRRWTVAARTAGVTVRAAFRPSRARPPPRAVRAGTAPARRSAVLRPPAKENVQVRADSGADSRPPGRPARRPLGLPGPPDETSRT